MLSLFFYETLSQTHTHTPGLNQMSFKPRCQITIINKYIHLNFFHKPRLRITFSIGSVQQRTMKTWRTVIKKTKQANLANRANWRFVPSSMFLFLLFLRYCFLCRTWQEVFLRRTLTLCSWRKEQITTISTDPLERWRRREEPCNFSRQRKAEMWITYYIHTNWGIGR